MNKNQILPILAEIKNFKQANGLKITDTHVHPLDVMGVVHFTETKDEFLQGDYLEPGIMEKLNYGKIEKIGSKIFTKVFPNNVNKIIQDTCLKVSQKRILQEMDLALIDNVVFLPVEPWVSMETIENKFSSERFMCLASIDIHRVKINEIENILKNSIIKYKVRGIKLHPNLQNFKPVPSDNEDAIAEKLDKIYKFAEKEHLYVLLHGGTSLFTNFINLKYQVNFQRSSINGLLKNFCNENGKSELFENYKCKFVIAHLGNYGIVNPDYLLLKKITEKFDNVSFDTAGCSPKAIKNVLDIVSSSKIIFGSDGIYNRLAYSLAFAYLGMQKSKSLEKKVDIIFNVFERNYKQL